MHKGIYALAIGGFGIGLTEFVVMGLLPDISRGLNVSIPQAGYMISAYALGVVLGAPTLTALFGKLSPTKALIALMAIFTLFNGLSSLPQNFTLMVVMRFLAGLPHGAYFGTGAVVASRLAKKGKEASAVSIMFAGLTLANVFGVPAGTYLGHEFSWRLAFAVVALIGVLTILAIKTYIPELPANPAQSIRQDLKIFKRPALWVSILLTSVGFAGFFAWISYIVPLLTRETGYAEATIPFLMTIAGVGMTVGNLYGGRLADSVSPLKAIIILLSLVTVVLCLNGLLAHSKLAMALLLFTTGAVALAICAPIQILLIAHAKEAEILGASLGQSSFNIGNALGAALGGIPLTLGFSYASPQWVGAGMSLAGVAIGVAMYFFFPAPRLSGVKAAGH